MAAKKREKRVRKPRPEERIDDLAIEIRQVSRQWSRHPGWKLSGREPSDYESTDLIELEGVVRHLSRLEVTSVKLTIYNRPEDLPERESVGICERVRGERSVLDATVWLPPGDLAVLAGDVAGGRFAEVGLRVKGFFRGKGRVHTITFQTKPTPAEELPED